MAAKRDHTMLEIDGREVRLSNPGKVYFPRPGWTKLDVVEYYLAAADAALVHLRERPTVMKRFVDGIEQEPIWQKRVPQKTPEWLETATVAFPSGRTATELVAQDAAHLAWAVNLGVIDFNPWPARRADLDHPDELRVDLDPTPGIGWDAVRRTAMVVRDVLSEHDLRGYPKTSGSKGIHVNVRIEPRWDFLEVRRAALALAREVERRVPDLATSRWWKEERHGVFLDYNQNAKDRTVAAAYSVRPTPDVRVSMPLSWDQVPGCRPDAYTLDSVPGLVAAAGDPSAGIDADAGSLEPLLDLADQHEAAGFADAPWPPHFVKAAGEPARAQPSKRRQPGPPVREGFVPPPAPGKTAGPTGRRRTTMPLIEVARAATEAEARQGLERWKARHAEVWPLLGPTDVLVDAMRGRSTVWYRIRLNLRNVPEDRRPPQEPLEVDYDPWSGRPAGT